MKVVNCAQGSAEWFEAKCGKVTSSRVADAIARLKRIKKGDVEPPEAAARANLRAQIVGERLTERIDDSYVSSWMQAGTEQEPLARTEYEIATGNDVRQVGFVEHPSIEWAGCSPDGIIGKEGALELKCPKDNTHTRYLLNPRELYEDYKDQCYWHLSSTGLLWCDLVSRNDHFPKKQQLVKVRIDRDERIIAGMNMEVRRFLAEVEETLEKILKGDDYLAYKLQQSIELVQAPV